MPLSDVTSFAATLRRSEEPERLPEVSRERAEQAEGPAFGDRLRDALQQVNEVQVGAEAMAEDYANGTGNDIHGTMIALEKADITLRLVSNLRNRVVEAYREVMRMGA